MTMEQQKDLDNKVNKLKKSVQEIEQDIQVLEDLQYEYDFKRESLEGQVEAETKGRTTTEMQTEETAIKQMFTVLNTKTEVVIKEMANVLTLAEQVQLTLISDELSEWRKRQQMACIGGPPNASLDQLQGWFTGVAECLQQIRQQLKKVQELVQKFTYNNDPLTLSKSQLDEQALSLFKNLITNSLVVERQPCMPTHPQRPLVIKTGVQFKVKIRGFSEMDTVKGFRNFLLLGVNTKVMNLDESSGCLTAEFRHLSLKEKRPINITNKWSLNVYEELHLISFDTQLILPDLCIDLLATCLPVVLIGGISKLSSAWGSILWYNMLCSEPHNLTFFLNPPPVKWEQLSKVISWQFSSVTKRALNSEQLRTVADKLLGHETQDDPEGLVHWKTFSSMSSSLDIESGGSPLDWIYEHLELTKSYVLSIWNDGYIMGFLSQEREKALLIDKLPGTFLLRFSESCREGGITITWVEHSADGEPVVHSAKPYTKVDMNRIPLPNFIRDYTVVSAGEKDPVNPLIYLYPDIPRDVAFGRYYTSASDGGDLAQSQVTLLPLSLRFARSRLGVGCPDSC
ncbi:signal transducer and activator of transcription 1-like isoform X2 [Pimephales promelas]|uniref:signal transducer and activator of transcription 1-like isoform X2 n=1 Tax=Pimephales promelas TaxID=90988 RepID=UPI001955CB78|nr:signal transducer and activator of transcription 1-like isoform X2 [Pimephales promelas]